MASRPPNFGPWPYGHAPADVFLDPDQGTINYGYFREYFDAVGLPLEVARACIGERYWSLRPSPPVGSVRFIALSALRRFVKLPPYHEVKHLLVEHTDIPGFTLSGPLSMWRGRNLFATSPCVFLSHRWRSTEEPDPDGERLAALLDRLAPRAAQPTAANQGEIYLWIDYACLPQRTGRAPLTAEDAASLRAGLASLPEIVKSCDLLVLDSPDYMERVWCYTELFVWLTKIAEVSDNLTGRPLFDSVLTRLSSSPAAPSRTQELLSSTQFVHENAAFRGFPGTADDLAAVYQPISTYCAGTIESAGYTLGAVDHEYVPHLIRFMCNSWYLLQQKHCTVADDRELCLQVITRALTFVNDTLRR
ncbi:MAG: hypothetical protein AB7H96_14975 [Vicinamibacterales bacterium]